MRESKHTFYVQYFFSPENHAFMRQCGRISYRRTGHRWQYGACASHNGHLRLQTHSEYVTLTAFPLQRWLHDSA